MAPAWRALADALTAAAFGAGVVALVAVAWGRTYALGGAVVAAAVALGSVPIALAAGSVVRRRPRRSTPADRITLLRTALAGGCAAVAVLVVAGQVPARSWWLLGLAVPALALDAVDGWVARRTGTASDAGARLDMEADAGMLLVLSAVVASWLGAWVLVVGAMRYAFVAASWLRPALAGPLPPSRLRRPAAAVQGAALAVAIAPVVPATVAAATVAAALALLVASFTRDVVALERRARDGRLSPRPHPTPPSPRSDPPAR